MFFVDKQGLVIQLKHVGCKLENSNEYPYGIYNDKRHFFWVLICALAFHKHVYEPRHEKTSFLQIRKQRHRSASR